VEFLPKLISKAI